MHCIGRLYVYDANNRLIKIIVYVQSVVYSQWFTVCGIFAFITGTFVSDCSACIVSGIYAGICLQQSVHPVAVL